MLLQILLPMKLNFKKLLGIGIMQAHDSNHATQDIRCIAISQLYHLHDQLQTVPHAMLVSELGDKEIKILWPKHNTFANPIVGGSSNDNIKGESGREAGVVGENLTLSQLGSGH